MKQIYFWFVLATTFLILSGCKKDDAINLELIPGEYIGTMSYFPSNNDGGVGYNIPELSAPEFNTTITKVESDYNLSFDKSFKNPLPDIRVALIRNWNSEIVTIGTLAGQSYTSTSALDGYTSDPPSYFKIDKSSNAPECHLALKSNDPDSIYYLLFILYRK